MGLFIKVGLGFAIALVFAIVIFGNLVAPPRTFTLAAAPDSLAHTTPSLSPLVAESNQFTQSTNAPDHNLTKNLASFVGKTILDLNPEGPREESLTVHDIQAIAAKALDESKKNFDASYFSPTIPADEVTVNATQTPELYRAAAQEIITDIETTFQPDTAISLAEQFSALAARYRTAVLHLKALPAPPDLVSEAQKNIASALRKQRILETAASYDQDPIHAFLALQLWKTNP